MSRCPITYEDITDNTRYSEQGLRLLSPRLKALKLFPYSASEQRTQAQALASKLSIQGIQPKLSTVLNVKDETFEIAERGGRYILKPQVPDYKHLPENEDLTMRLAALVNINTPVHGLIYSKDETLTYFIKRFDRRGQKEKLHIEDFAQLSNESRDTKYESSMEKVAEVIEQHCTFPAIEKVKLFKRTLFSFLIGNEDMHLKNLSLIVDEDRIRLSPAYDLVNTTTVLAKPREELALPVNGKKRNLTRNDLFRSFAKEHLGISGTALADVEGEFRQSIPQWELLIKRSFLPNSEQERYLNLVRERTARMALA